MSTNSDMHAMSDGIGMVVGMALMAAMNSARQARQRADVNGAFRILETTVEKAAASLEKTTRTLNAATAEIRVLEESLEDAVAEAAELRAELALVRAGRRC